MFQRNQSLFEAIIRGQDSLRSQFRQRGQLRDGPLLFIARQPRRIGGGFVVCSSCSGVVGFFVRRCWLCRRGRGGQKFRGMGQRRLRCYYKSSIAIIVDGSVLVDGEHSDTAIRTSFVVHQPLLDARVMKDVIASHKAG